MKGDPETNTSQETKEVIIGHTQAIVQDLALETDLSLEIDTTNIDLNINKVAIIHVVHVIIHAPIHPSMISQDTQAQAQVTSHPGRKVTKINHTVTKTLTMATNTDKGLNHLNTGVALLGQIATMLWSLIEFMH